MPVSKRSIINEPTYFPTPKRRRKRAKQEFNPSREQCQSAIDEYLKAGGKITKLETPHPVPEFFNFDEAYHD